MHGVIPYHAMHHQPIRYHDYDILHSHCDISVHYTICLLYLDQPASAKVPICTPPTQVVRVLCSSSLLNWWYSIRPNYLNNLDGYSKSHHLNKTK